MGDAQGIARSSKSPAPKEPILLDVSTLKNIGGFDGARFCVPTLTFMNGPAIGKELPLVHTELTLGRGEESDVVLPDPSVSRQHVQLICRKVVDEKGQESLKVVLRDLGSKNGTLVNYRRVRKAVLRPNDKVTIGQIILKFEYRDLAEQNYHEEMYRLTTTDTLTSLLNKWAVTRMLLEEITKRQRYWSRLSILLLDLDNFKACNDKHGHIAGDRVLQGVARVLSRNLRRADKAGRFGGEEFLIVLPETGVRGAKSLANRIRADVFESAASEADVDESVTVSVGIATYSKSGSGLENLLASADAALYQAKRAGKNRVECWKGSDPPDNGKRSAKRKS